MWTWIGSRGWEIWNAFKQIEPLCEHYSPRLALVEKCVRCSVPWSGPKGMKILTNGPFWVSQVGSPGWGSQIVLSWWLMTSGDTIECHSEGRLCIWRNFPPCNHSCYWSYVFSTTNQLLWDSDEKAEHVSTRLLIVRTGNKTDFWIPVAVSR